MKKCVSALMISAMLLVPSVAHADVPVWTEEPATTTTATQMVTIPSLKYFQSLYDTVPEVEKEEWTRTIRAYEDYRDVMHDLYTSLPHKVTFQTALTRQQLREFESKFQDEITVSKLPNYILLANYSFEKFGARYGYIDKTHPLHSAKKIEAVTKQYAVDFAQNIEGKSSAEKFAIIYDFVYNHYSYSANNYSSMLVGYAPTGIMACNGFSRLMYELLNASGIDTKLMHSDDHFYNQVKIADVFGAGDGYFTVDITTDILLKTKHGATGLSQAEHLNYVAKVGFYFARPIPKDTKVSMTLSSKQKEQITSIKPQYTLQFPLETPNAYKANPTTKFYHYAKTASELMKNSVSGK